MCGIVAVISSDKVDLMGALDAMAHRGPDAFHQTHIRVHDAFVNLGHCRLKVIDLNDDSNQPFFSPCHQYCLSFNGEIYNYLELKKDLMAAGFEFTTTSDTEVLLNSYIHWGVDAFSKLNGMFAFALLDQVQEKLFIVRDQLGIKPAYYHIDEDTCSLYVASEIKGLCALGVQPVIDYNLIGEFILNNWLYEPETGFENIKKVNPASYLIYDLAEKSSQVVSYYEFPRLVKPLKHSSYEEIIERDVMSQLQSDVPLGVFFSGGNDSALISAISSKYCNYIRCIFSKYNASDLNASGVVDDAVFVKKISRKISMNLSSAAFDMNDYGSDLFKIIDSAVQMNEELIADFTCLSSNAVSKIAKQHGLTVMLSGMGADEVYAGYPRYLLMRYFSVFKLIGKVICPFYFLLAKIPKFSKKIKRFVNFIEKFNSESFSLSYSSLLGYLSYSDLLHAVNDRSVLNSAVEKHKELDSLIDGLSYLKKALYLDRIGFLPHNFIVADKSSMLESIELRVPLSTPDAYTCAFSKADNTLIKRFKTKLPIKKLLTKYIPSELVNRKKAGFNPPLDQWIWTESEETIIDELSETLSFFFKNEFIINLVRRHYMKVENNTYIILQLLYLSRWIRFYSNLDVTHSAIF